MCCVPGCCGPYKILITVPSQERPARRRMWSYPPPSSSGVPGATWRCPLLDAVQLGSCCASRAAWTVCRPPDRLDPCAARPGAGDRPQSRLPGCRVTLPQAPRLRSCDPPYAVSLSWIVSDPVFSATSRAAPASWTPEVAVVPPFERGTTWRALRAWTAGESTPRKAEPVARGCLEPQDSD